MLWAVRILEALSVVGLAAWGNDLASQGISDLGKRRLTRLGIWAVAFVAVLLVVLSQILNEWSAATQQKSYQSSEDRRAQKQVSEYERFTKGLFVSLLNRLPPPSKSSLSSSPSPQPQPIYTPPAIAVPQLQTTPSPGASRTSLAPATPNPPRTPFNLLDFRCQNGRTNTTPEQTYVISNDTLMRFYNAISQAFFPDTLHQEPAAPAVSVATCTITDDGPVPIYHLQLQLAWEVARNNVQLTLPGRFLLLVDRVTNQSPVAIRFANAVPGRLVVIAPTTYCWLELPGDTDYQKCTLTRYPHLDARDPAWHDLKDPPTLMVPNFSIK
jgi:hypothetical protein